MEEGRHRKFTEQLQRFLDQWLNAQNESDPVYRLVQIRSLQLYKTRKISKITAESIDESFLASYSAYGHLANDDYSSAYGYLADSYSPLFHSLINLHDESRDKNLHESLDLINKERLKKKMPVFRESASRRSFRHTLNRVSFGQETPARKKMEVDLEKRIETLIPQSKMREYNKLYSKFKKGHISEIETKRLLTLNDEIEILNAEKLKYIGELAQIRGQSLREVMNDLRSRSI